MEFGILGPLHVLAGERSVEIPGRRLRTLLAALIVHAGTVVSRDRLLEILWGPEPSEGALATLHSHVSHLREALESGRLGGGRSLVVTQEPGYVLAVDPHESVDAGRFERLVVQGSHALAEESAARAADHLHRALNLWRGEPLAEFTFAPFAQAEIARLEELRLTALEHRFEAELALGRHAEVIGEIRALVAEQPLRERLWGLLMLALYRSARQADSLRAYAELRQVLGEQLGIEPSPELARLEESIVLQKPELDWQPAPQVAERARHWDPTPPVPEPAAVEGPRALVERGLSAFARRAWLQAYGDLTAADRAGALTPPQLEALAEATFWTGRSGECIALCERLHHLYLEDGNQRRAAYAALMVSLQHAVRLRMSVAAGWFALASQLLEGEGDCVERGYMAWAMATVLVVMGTADPAPALAGASQVLDAAERFRDLDLRAVGLTYRGYILVHQGQVAEGMGLLDQAMARAAAGVLGPLATAAVVCRTLSACIDVHDYGRTAEWLVAMERCTAEHGLAGFPGDCRMHYAQVLLARGAWPEAARQARMACAEMDDFVREHAGLAFATLGEVLRLSGDLDGAEEAFGQADELGRSPQPGLALVQLARGDQDAARASLGQALTLEPWNLLERSRLLGALVEVCLATGDKAAARDAADELARIAATFSSAGLTAAADYGGGVLALAEGHAAAAVELLERSWRAWRKIGATYAAARARAQLAVARTVDGDVTGARLDLGAAQATFERLGARGDAADAARLFAALPEGRPTAGT